MDLAVATALLLQYKYALMVPLAIIEGPILSMACGFFVSVGALALAPTFIALAIGDLIGDSLWYWLGRSSGHRFIARFGHYVSITEENVATVQRIFDRYHTTILIFSKLTMGLGFPGAILFTAGMTRIPFWKFIGLNTLGQVIWTSALLALGFYLGDVYATYEGAFGIVSIAGIMALTLFLLFGFSRFLRGKIVKKLS